MDSESQPISPQDPRIDQIEALKPVLTKNGLQRLVEGANARLRRVRSAPKTAKVAISSWISMRKPKFGVAISDPELLTLAPSYDESNHGVYLRAIESALERKGARNIRNIALTGGYGGGKSSVLREVARIHRKHVVEVSLSTLGIHDEPAPAKDKEAKVAPALTRTNRIQKEIVKQILYQEKPSGTPESRYRRISRSGYTREAGLALLLAAPLAAAIHIVGWSTKFLDLAWPGHLVAAESYWVTFATTAAFLYALRALFRGKVWIDKLTAGSATISLTRPTESYFDEYLDEIVYFFETSKCDIVILEDIDRFDDPHIFESLRALNTLLNNAKQLGGRPVRFIYAIKDSIFDELGRLVETGAFGEGGVPIQDAARTELARSNRTKFFDLVIPVVPFITHRNARDLMTRTMGDAGISTALTDLAGRHVTDMRLIKNVRNEFLIFRDKVLAQGNGLNLREDSLYAMILYKNIHLSDFESIRTGISDLDLLYADYRNLVAENIDRLESEERSLRSRLERLDSVAARSERLGDELLLYIERLMRHTGSNRRPNNITYNGAPLTDQEIRGADFWKAYLSSVAPLHVRHSSPFNGGSVLLQLSSQDVGAALGEELSPNEWEGRDRAEFRKNLDRIHADWRFVASADMKDLIGRDEFTLKKDSGDASSLKQLASARLRSDLARQLVAEGYIDRNFSLYVSSYYGERVSARALNFIIHNVESGIIDMHFILEPEDVEAIIRESGKSFLVERTAYNTHLLDHLLAKDDGRAEAVVRALSSFGADEERFLKVYLARGKLPHALARKLVFYSGLTLVAISGMPEIADADRPLLLNAALESLSPNLQYKTDHKLKAIVEQHYAEMPAFTSDSISAEQARLIVDILVSGGIRLDSLAPLGSEQIRASVVESRYAITGENLVVAVGESDRLALDDIRDRNRAVYSYALNNLPRYLEAIRSVQKSLLAIRSREALPSVLEDAAAADPGTLSDLLQLSSPECRFGDLTKAPSAAWTALAKTERFDPTLANVAAYSRINGIDAHLAGVLILAGAIDIEMEPQEPEKQELAKEVLSAKALPDPELRASLVDSMRLGNYLSIEDVPNEEGKLVGILIEKDLVEDNSDTFSITLDKDWRTREFAISKSKNFAMFMTPKEVPPSDIVHLLRSEIVPENVKAALLERPLEFIAEVGSAELFALAECALQSRIALDANVLERLAAGGVEPSLVLRTLELSVSGLSLSELEPILAGLGGIYATLSEPNGKRPKLPDTSPNRALVHRLSKLDIVSSFEPSGGLLAINMRKIR